MSSIKAAAAAFDLPLVKDLPLQGVNYTTSKGGSKTARSLNTTIRLGHHQANATYSTLEPND